MDNSDAMSINEAEIYLLFEEAGLADPPVPDIRRVNQVIERTLHEKAIKDTASFVFLGFPAVVMGFMSVATNAVGNPNTDYRV